MNVEAVNSVLTRAIVGLQAGEIEIMAEAMIGDYEIPSPKGFAFGKGGSYKVPAPPKPRKQRAKKGGKLSAAKKKQIIGKIYRLLPPNNRDTLKDEGGYYPKRATLKAGGRRVVYWGWNIEKMMGPKPGPKSGGPKGQSFVYLDELPDDMLEKMLAVLDKRASRGPAGVKWKDTAKGYKLLTKVSGEKLLEVLRYMVSEKMGAEVNGVFVDISSANLIVQIADKLNPQNRAKFLGLPVGAMGSMAWELASKSGGVTFG
jgi:hypothetical protein